MKRGIGIAAIVLATAALPAFAQDVTGLLGETSAHTLPVKSLDGAWRRIVVSGVTLPGGGMDMSQLALLGAMGDKGGKGPGEAMGAMLGMSMLGGMFGGGGGSSPMGAGLKRTANFTR